MTWPVPEIDDVTAAFPADALAWMPSMDQIPDEFHDCNGRTVWEKIAHAWFQFGLPDDVAFYPCEGVDPEKAIRAIQARLGSYAPSHQHKIAATAYMLSCWFVKIEKWEKPAAARRRAMGLS